MPRLLDDETPAQVRVCPRCGAREQTRAVAVPCVACAVVPVVVRLRRDVEFTVVATQALRAALVSGRLHRVPLRRSRWTKHVRRDSWPSRPSGTS